MSTNFFILPSKIYIPSYKQIIDLANVNTNAFLLNIGIHREIDIQANLQNIKTHKLLNWCPDDKIVHNEGEYVWFYVSGVPGGTDCWYHKNLPIFEKVWKDELYTNPNAQKHKKIIMENLSIGYQWSFRRSAGQPGIVCLIYGILAAALAELTDGVIYSDDGAWDNSMLPTTFDDFIEKYFNTNFTENKDCIAFANDCIKLIKNELL